MRAWQVEELGHPSESLRLTEDAPAPEPGPGEVRLDVEATNVNFADILLCQGIYQARPPLPFTPGLETCGTVDAVGPGVDLALGARVAGLSAMPAGGYAEKALIPAAAALVMPDDIPAEAATVLYSTFHTAHVGLHHRGGLRADEWLLVNGASSGIGGAAVQLGAVAGAKVIATAGSDEKRQHCVELGAHIALDSGSPNLRAEILEHTGGRGVDVAFDPVGGAVGEVTRRVMAWEGRLVVVGFAAGEVPSYPGNHLLVKNYAVLGLHWGDYANHGHRHVLEPAHEELLALYRAGRIDPDVSRVLPLADVPAALAALEERAVTGRLVVTP